MKQVTCRSDGKNGSILFRLDVLAIEIKMPKALSQRNFLNIPPIKMKCVHMLQKIKS